MNKLVSIIVPCYNQAQYLDEALQSVFDQTYTNWECIIINDGSPDNTEEVAKKWVSKDSRFVYLKKENGGLSSARNAGINTAKGVFILPLDADDKIGANYVALAVQTFQHDDSLKVVYCKAEKFGNESGPWQLSPFSLYDLCQFNMVFCSALYRKKDWEVVGGYDINMIYGLEDWEFWISVLKNGGKVKRLEKVGFYYRIKDISMLKQLNNEKNSYSMEYMSIKHADFFVKQIGSFTQLKNTIKQSTEVIRKNNEKLKDKKFVIDIFCKTFFGFTFFGKYKNDI
jgi:glycosyltransferase involved in cell wall biosynthesis